MMAAPRACWQRHETAKLDKALRAEVKRHEASASRLRRILRSA